MLPPSASAGLDSERQTEPQYQTAQATFPVFYLVPDATTAVRLQTHTADFQISDAGDGLPLVSFEGLYRFKNEGEEAVALTLVFVYDGEDRPLLPISLTANGVPINAEPIEDGYQAELRIAPDTSLDVRLVYSAQLDSAPLALLRYDIRELVAWPGSSSLRTTIVMPERIAPASWIDVAPEGWNYATLASSDSIGIHWLYDGAFPQGPFLFQFVMPETWQRISTLSAAELGDLYQGIYESLSGSNFSETGERFYAQALASYTLGIDSATANSRPVAGLQAGLASLYRGRILETDGDPDPGYLALMVQTTTDALAGLPADDIRRAELQQWQADGLRQLLVEAQQNGDWPIVLALLDEMETLSQPPFTPDALLEARRAATVLQALELLEAGHRDDAIALAGDEVVDEALRPGPELQSLFAGWQVTTTITPDSIDLILIGHPVSGQLESAREALNQQLAKWQEMPVRAKASISLDEISSTPENRALRLEISVPDRDAALTLAQGMTPGPDWALLHSLLEQIAPLVQSENRRLRRDLTMEQTFDLRGAGMQWASMAENLESESTAIESTGRGINPGDPAAVEAALRARIQAANYRTASNEWRNLGSNSWVTTELRASDVGIADGTDTGAGNESSRLWLTTVEMPSQTYTLHAETLNSTRVVILGIVLLGILLLLSGLLWRLL